MTDSAKKEALLQLLKLTTMTSKNIVIRKFPLSFFSSQDTTGYIDTNSQLYLLFMRIVATFEVQRSFLNLKCMQL